MLDRRSFLLGLLSALAAAPALATPGAVNRQGCHGKPRHCHSRAETLRQKNGRRYVPGKFFRHRPKRRKRR